MIPINKKHRVIISEASSIKRYIPTGKDVKYEEIAVILHSKGKSFCTFLIEDSCVYIAENGTSLIKVCDYVDIKDIRMASVSALFANSSLNMNQRAFDIIFHSCPPELEHFCVGASTISVCSFRPSSEILFHLEQAWLAYLARLALDIPVGHNSSLIESNLLFDNMVRYIRSCKDKVKEKIAVLQELAEVCTVDFNFKRRFYSNEDLRGLIFGLFKEIQNRQLGRTESVGDSLHELSKTANKIMRSKSDEFRGFSSDLLSRTRQRVEQMTISKAKVLTIDDVNLILQCLRLLLSVLFNSHHIVEKKKLFESRLFTPDEIMQLIFLKLEVPKESDIEMNVILERIAEAQVHIGCELFSWISTNVYTDDSFIQMFMNLPATVISDRLNVYAKRLKDLLHVQLDFVNMPIPRDRTQSAIQRSLELPPVDELLKTDEEIQKERESKMPAELPKGKSFRRRPNVQIYPGYQYNNDGEPTSPIPQFSRPLLSARRGSLGATPGFFKFMASNASNGKEEKEAYDELADLAESVILPPSDTTSPLISPLESKPGGIGSILSPEECVKVAVNMYQHVKFLNSLLAHPKFLEFMVNIISMDFIEYLLIDAKSGSNDLELLDTSLIFNSRSIEFLDNLSDSLARLASSRQFRFF